MRKSPTANQLQPRKTFPALSPAELRLVAGGQEMEHGGRIRR